MIIGKYTNWIYQKIINLTWNKNGIDFSVKKLIKTVSIDINWKLIGRYSFRKIKVSWSMNICLYWLLFYFILYI